MEKGTLFGHFEYTNDQIVHDIFLRLKKISLSFIFLHLSDETVVLSLSFKIQGICDQIVGLLRLKKRDTTDIFEINSLVLRI